MEAVLIAIVIFALRIIDVSIGTIRVLYTIRGNRMVAASLGLIEAGIWIFAITRAIKYVDNPMSMLGWALGYATGTILGITMEKWIATGSILLRVISVNVSRQLREQLLEKGFGVTSLAGEGRSGPVSVLFIVAPRRRAKEAFGLIQKIDPQAFVTVDPVDVATGGYIPPAMGAAGMRK